MNDRAIFDALDARIKALLPDDYQDRYEALQPVPMRSAGLKFDPDGRVAWDEIWGSFCDLAMAGGPPHKGTLLEPGTQEAIDAQPERYQSVAGEICRGITMVTGLPARVSPVPGWVRVTCVSHTMAWWLLRAITAENVAARADVRDLDLPAAPHFRLDKEIKNVVTVVAKTCHYWLGHTSRRQQVEIGNLLLTMEEEAPLVEPLDVDRRAALDGHRSVVAAMSETIRRETGLPAPAHEVAAGWIGVDCPTVGAAIFMMRAAIVSNVLSRREGTVLLLPVNPLLDPGGVRIVSAVIRAHRFARSRGVL